MMSKIRAFGLLIMSGLVVFLSTAAQFAPGIVQPAPTALPKTHVENIVPDSMIGKSDGILFLGILIFVFIAIPILIHYHNHKTQN
jgi:hypothetical protein